MVYRIYVEKKEDEALEAKSLLADISDTLGISGVEKVHVVNRYDAENIERDTFESAVGTVFSEPLIDRVYRHYPYGSLAGFASEYLPGQFDMRADSASQCIQLLSQGSRPDVKSAKIYSFEGNLSQSDLLRIKRYIINPVECREADMSDTPPETISITHPTPDDVPVLFGFSALDEASADDFIAKYGLAMDRADLLFCRDYFRGEGREPTLTEVRMIDTYWSDHCRHTTFLTEIDGVSISDPTIKETYEEYLSIRRELGREKKPVTLMDIGTIAAKYLSSKGMLEKLDVSEEINACTVKIKVNHDGNDEDWLLLFKNETHNHPTEIEPFGGAATCIGGAIRDPLSGRAYVYSAMRITGASDPTRPISETLEGKLPQRKLTVTAAEGYSSYGNQIGLATGMVDEVYHDGYVAKRMEIGAVIGAVPAENVRRERPDAGDIVILLGGKTGRDGCGGATGSSKSHTTASLSVCGAEVQKGNAPEERKLQRLFRNRDAEAMIKRCNDFGAGGVSVAVGELADGLKINLDLVPKKYEGLTGTELAISESQERMAVVVEAKDAAAFIAIAESENLEATAIAEVTSEPRLVMTWRGKEIVNVGREFLNSNGAPKHITINAAAGASWQREIPCGSFSEAMVSLSGNLNICSKRGLAERFDSTIGAGTVLMPFGGKYQLTPPQAMVNLIPTEHGHTDTCSFMSWGFNPEICERSPYHGAYLSVFESVAKLIAAGAEFSDVYLTFQEYFEKPNQDPDRWGKPFSALLGALRAQCALGVAAVGGKDSMSGSFENLDVPPALVSFAVTTGRAADAKSPEFKAAGHDIVMLTPEYGEDGLPTAESFIKTANAVTSLLRSGKAVSAWSLGAGGVAEGIMKMSFGNKIGAEISPELKDDALFGYRYGSFLLEIDRNCDISDAVYIGKTSDGGEISRGDESVTIDALLSVYEGRLESVFPCNIKQKPREIPAFSYTERSSVTPASVCAKPRVLIPVFPGTSCEYDTAKAMEDAGAEPHIFIVNNLSKSKVEESVKAFAKLARESKIIFIPGGFSGGDEPDGSGKFITAFFRAGEVSEAVNDLLTVRRGLMCGICNGFQALIKLGLVPYGEIVDFTPEYTLTYNTIGRHQSRLVRTRVASVKSPWMSRVNVGDVITVPISHGEGRFYASDELIEKLSASGQIATQYVGTDGLPSSDISVCPNDSAFAVEGITSPDGRVLGKMGHSERTGRGLYKNVEGNYDMGLFASAVEYFK
ncbi:MAG: phosphoribosylformylglycinamidine synthase [Firmicutes bacterium]|nr:phosphoribosylformylglycinamidine synthase [Bacillota bacterium]